MKAVKNKGGVHRYSGPLPLRFKEHTDRIRVDTGWSMPLVFEYLAQVVTNYNDQSPAARERLAAYYSATRKAHAVITHADEATREARRLLRQAKSNLTPNPQGK